MDLKNILNNLDGRYIMLISKTRQYIIRDEKLLVHVGGGDLSLLDLNKTFIVEKAFSNRRYSGNYSDLKDTLDPIWIFINLFKKHLKSHN